MASGRLSVDVRVLKARLRRCGFVLVRQVGAHEQWRCGKTRRAVTLSIHGPTIRGDQVKSIYEQAGWAWRIENDKRRKVKKAPAPEVATPVVAPVAPPPPRPRVAGTDPVSRTAARILGGETANRAGRAEGLSLNAAYSIAHGTHPKLLPGVAARLQALWKHRGDTNASGRVRLKATTVGLLVDAIMRGEPVKTAAARLGINEKSAWRIAMGRHRALSPQQRIALQKRPNYQPQHTPLQLRSAAALRLELERVQTLLEAERKLTAMLREGLAAMAASGKRITNVPGTPAMRLSCLHAALMHAIEEAIDRRLSSQQGASQRTRRFVRNDTIGFVVMSGKNRCAACDEVLDERALREAVWPY